MRIKELILQDFGPFKDYKISFLEENDVSVLLTGKNNEGKSSIINALKLLNSATKVLNKKKQERRIDGNIYYKLLQQDTEELLVGRMIHNYSNNTAKITGIFQNRFKIDVFLDPIDKIIYAQFDGYIPSDIQEIFGFIPPLGPLSENEDIITVHDYLRASINTSLAPRHLRNHLWQMLSKQEFALVKEIIRKSWDGIELINYELDFPQGKIFCYYKEDRIDREISWAGQGLQVWFQIITHFVRLINASILILDEPEINLHPQKQNDLIRILRDYYHGSIIIATHSVELMNNVSVSHIINIQKINKEPKIKSTHDRTYLDLVRSQVGSNFNLIASQFEEFDVIIFTEDVFDFSLLEHLAKAFGIRRKAFNIPIHGFSEYRKCLAYKHAYELLIGKHIPYTLVLDRDYYPEDYLMKIKNLLVASNIRVVFTIGKEIENLFLSPNILSILIPDEFQKEFYQQWNQMFTSTRVDCYATYLTLHQKFLEQKLDIKTVTTTHTATFENCWNSNQRHIIVDGKDGLKLLRSFYKDVIGKNLNQSLLIEKLVEVDNGKIKKFMEEIFHIRKASEQVLHY
ncbi:MAG TPA: AAA family ATPase [Chitinophagales bacterium]|nr:AAA family ATPase [Chitinophagales bacterium]